MKSISLIASFIFITGCASVASTLSSSSSGVLPYKNNTFMVTTGNAVSTSAQKQAYTEANEYCKSTNLAMKVAESEWKGESYFTLYFYCN